MAEKEAGRMMPEAKAVTRKRNSEKWQNWKCLRRACWGPSFSKFCRRVNTLCLFGMSDSRRFKRAFVFCVLSVKGRKEARPPFGWK